MRISTPLLLLLSVIVAGFIYTGIMVSYSLSPVHTQKPQQIAYTEFDTPYGHAKVAPGQSLTIEDDNSTTDKSKGEKSMALNSDQGRVSGDKVKGSWGAQTFNWGDYSMSDNGSSYFAQQLVRSAWLICLIGLLIIGAGFSIAVFIPGLGWAVGGPVCIVGGIVFVGGLIAMLFETAYGLLLLILVAVPVGYMLWRSHNKNTSIASLQGQVANAAEATKATITPTPTQEMAQLITAIGSLFQKPPTTPTV